MNSTLKTRTLVQAVLATTLLVTGCDRNGDKGSSDAPPKAVTPKNPTAMITRVGIEPGPVIQDQGALAVLAISSGSIDVKVLGEEGYRPMAEKQVLYQGDQVRTADGAQATLLFADGSTVELAELTTVQIGSRLVTADPASTAAVLGGVARFNITPRAPAEGPFIVFTPAGLVATKGTVFGVGVAADGDARVGVEEGSVEVAGSAAFDAPVVVEADHAIELAAAGTLGAQGAFPEDDWGVWRDTADAKLNVDATVAAHGAAMADLGARIDAMYASLEGLAADMGKLEAQAAANADLKATAAYEASLQPMAVTIDASYLAALELAWLTHAHAAHASLASELYLRHPEITAWAKVEPEVHASVLWTKRLDATASFYLEPLRMQYYVHHARGRARAELVGIVVPEFYASVTPPVVQLADARAKLKIKGYVAPEITAVASARDVWVASPKMKWQQNAKFKITPPRGKVGFCVRPPQLQSTAMLGAKVQGEISSIFAATAPKARADFDLKGKANFAMNPKIHLDPPNLRLAAKARAKFDGKYEMPTLALDAHAPKIEAGIHAKESVELKAKTQLKAVGKVKADLKHQVKAQTDAVAGIGASAKAAAGAAANAGAGLKSSAKLEVKAPKVEVKAPSVSASAKGSAKMKLGN